MASAFPSGLDNFATNHVDLVNEIIHAQVDNDQSDALNKIEAALGTNPQGGAATVAARIAALETLVVAPVGSTMDYAGTGDPAGGKWLLADGRAISRTTFATAFGLMGTTYGVGDGSTTFNIPDLRGRTTFGPDDMGTAAGTAARITTNDVRGNVGGADLVTLATAEMPVHTHTFAGTALASHTHTFTGTALATHTHTFTGTILGTHSHGPGTLTSGVESADHSHTMNHDHALQATPTSTGIGNTPYTQTGPVQDLGGGGAGAPVKMFNGSTGGISANHTHSITSGVTTAVTAGTPAGSNASVSAGTPAGTNASVSAGTPAGTNSNAGSGSAHNNMPPYQVMNKIIRVA